MRIAICDDNKQELLRISSLVEAYRHKKKAELTYKAFQNATELLAFMHGGDYDVLLLDVMMPGVNGMQAAHEIRGFDSKVKIIFLTSTPEFAVESYSVQAHHYLLKPATEEKLYPILDNLYAELRKPEEALSIKTQSSVLHIPYGKIEYLEVNSKTLYFSLTDGSVREVSGSLADFEQILVKRPEFIKVHRSYLVNMQWIMELRQSELITASGHHVPISRATYPLVRTVYTRFLFSEGFARNEGGDEV